MSQVFAFQLDLKIQKTNIGAPKIDDATLKTYEIIVPTYSILNKDDKVRFFEKSFLLANIKLNIVFGIHFLTINNVDIDFKAQKL